MKFYIKSWLHLLTTSVVILSTMYISLEKLTKNIPPLPKMVYIITGLSALYLAINRNVYLPFLGETVYPCDNMNEIIPKNAKLTATINILPKKKIIYWASEPSDNIVTNPWDAYGNYSNYGITTSNEQGKAIIHVRDPSSYKVPSGKILKPHIHYRYCQEPGVLSEIKTIQL